MSDDTNPTSIDLSGLDNYPSLQAVVRRVEAADKLACAPEIDEYDDEPCVVIEYPCERGTRTMTYNEEEAALLLSVKFEDARFLRQTGGIYFMGGQGAEIPVRVRRPGMLSHIPGATVEAPPKDRYARLSQYKIRVGNRKGCFVELSRPSASYAAVRTAPMFGRSYTLKVTVAKRKFPTSSTEIEELVREVGLAFLFELDLLYGLSADFAGVPADSYVGWQEIHADKPAFPKLAYPMQALSLYQYARGAFGLPLLAFLGYYQVLEFFFPVFSQRAAVQRVRHLIRNPRFSLASDQAVLEVVQSARVAGSASASERQQLLSAIEYCARPDQILEYIRTPDIEDYFTAKTQPLPGMIPLRLNDSDGLLKQVADRVYDIRCRVVHTKADGGDGAVDLLLPDSAAVRELGPDVELARILAQYALVAGAETLDLN